MGINSGPVYRVADINANRNVAGGGIKQAQRVMDRGDVGHILMSKAVLTLGSISDQCHAHNYIHGPAFLRASQHFVNIISFAPTLVLHRKHT